MTESPESSVQPKPQGSFINKGLFSDHFLIERLPKWKEWQIQQELTEFRQKLSDLYNSQKLNLPKYSEAQTEQDFIKPALDFLGYSDSFIVQASVSTGTPDYALFPDKMTASRAHKKKGEIDYAQCIAIADAKYWERDLDATKYSKKDTYTHKNPSFQIVSYLTGTQKTWGILTNGRLWRLYNLKSHLPIGNYYQVDIVDLLNASPDKLKYFYLFFRKEALISDASGKTFLDRIFEGSNDYAVELENNIKDRAYEVVQLICQGFAANYNGKQPDASELKEIYNNSLTLLYRLLFVFYAEARELLPLSANQGYRDNYSLRSLIHKIEDAQKKNLQFSLKSLNYYQNLTNLFNLIDSGDTSLDIPEYNGGLFDSSEHPFLSQHTIADYYLVKVIRHLAWVIDKEIGYEVMVDYNTLSERHLGSIYEGLLEFKPAIAQEDLVEIKEKGKTNYALAKQYPQKKVICQKGDLYLVNEKGERKATGSYYTPDYIVKYIVENTLDDLVKEAQLKAQALKPQVEAEINKWERLIEQKLGLEPVEKYHKVIARERERLLEPYLSLKVLDPAMGSGHFLTRATDFLAMAVASDPSFDSSSNLDEEGEITYYRRRVVESCIYGVDLNPLAVELAKLTLWLSTMAKSKPLSFLNHHLRVGNSLIGARVSDLDEILKVPVKKRKIDPTHAPLQIGQFEGAFQQKLILLLKNRALITQFPSDTYQDVQNKKKWEDSFQEDIQRFRLLADIWVSRHFGNKLDWGEYNTLALNLNSPKSEWDVLIKKSWVQKSITLRQEKHFFHWELEFPEVFYTEQGLRKENAGFDAVLGNPPYGSLFDSLESEYISRLYNYVKYREESYVAFMEQFFQFIREQGSVSFIVPDNWMYLDFTENLRNKFLVSGSLRLIVALPRSIFPEATVDTCIYVLEKSESSDINKQTFIIPYDKNVSLTQIGSNNGFYQEQEYWAKSHGKIINPYLYPTETRILEKVVKIGVQLENICHIGYGLKAYQVGKGKPPQTSEVLRDKPYTSNVKKSEDFFPFFEGESLNRYELLWDYDNWIKWGSWLAEPRHEDLFTGPRLLFRKVVGTRLIGSYTNEKVFSNTLLYIINLQPNVKYNLLMLLSCLNSKLIGFIFRKMYAIREDDTFPQILLDDIASLLIPQIKFGTSKKKRQRLFEQAKSLYLEYLQSQSWNSLLEFVIEHLRQKQKGVPDIKQEESDVVHDLLAFLAEEMLRLNIEKHDVSKNFLDWLEQEVIKGSVEEQKNKTKIRNFHENPFEELEKILKENKKIPDPCPSDIRNTILNEFNKAVSIINPLKSTIALTDKLIDHVVYKLYRLTEDEIKIVEGKSV